MMTLPVTMLGAAGWKSILEGGTLPGQRPVRPDRVRAYARRMADGTWIPSASLILIDGEGRLINGVHRATAALQHCERTGGEVGSLITTVEDPRAFVFQDESLATRSLTDCLRVLRPKGRYFSTIASFVHVVSLFDAEGIPPLDGSKRDVDRPRVLEFADANWTRLEEVAKMARDIAAHDNEKAIHGPANRSGLVTGKIAGTLLWTIWTHPDRDGFWTGYMEGLYDQNVRNGDARAAAMLHWRKVRDAQGDLAVGAMSFNAFRYRVTLAASAWNAWTRGTPWRPPTGEWRREWPLEGAWTNTRPTP